MKKWTVLLLTLMLLCLAACGQGGDASLTRGSMPEGGEPADLADPAGAEAQNVPTVTEPEKVDWDLAICQPEEAYREVEHYNIDPRGYRGMSLRLTGEFSMVLDHGKTFYYCGVRDDDGCIENLELRFPGDGSEPEGFPEDGSVITVWGRLGTYTAQRDGKDRLCAVLTDVQFTLQTDFRD